MKLCTVQTVTGLDNKPHFAIAGVGQPGWPIALFGPADGPLAKKSKAEAAFFADAPAMMDMLEVVVKEFKDINPAFPLSNGKMAELQILTERAFGLLAKHAEVR